MFIANRKLGGSNQEGRKGIVESKIHILRLENFHSVPPLVTLTYGGAGTGFAFLLIPFYAKQTQFQNPIYPQSGRVEICILHKESQ